MDLGRFFFSSVVIVFYRFPPIYLCIHLILHRFFPGAGGRISEKGATLSQYIVQQIVLKKPDERDKDPRGAILRHAEEAAKNPFYVTPAYKE